MKIFIIEKEFLLENLNDIKDIGNSNKYCQYLSTRLVNNLYDYDEYEFLKNENMLLKKRNEYLEIENLKINELENELQLVKNERRIYRREQIN